MSLYLTDGTEFNVLSRGSAFESYLSTLKPSTFPKTIGKHTHGKKLIIMGDSLVAYGGGDGLTGSKFLTQINKTLGMNISPSGYAGSNWTGEGVGDAPTKVQGLLDDGVTYDVIILAWGTNSDTNAGLGTVDDVPSKTGTMCAVMKWVVQSVRAMYPNAGLGIIIPPAGSGGCTEDKANLMIDCCRSSRMHVPYLDMWHEAGIYVDNGTNGVCGLGADMVHLSEAGINRYASALAQFIERICPHI